MSKDKLFDIGQLSFMSDESFIHHCYVRAFRRACDPSRAKLYLSALSSGTSRGELIKIILQADDRSRSANIAALRQLLLLDGELFLHEAYRRILGRQIDSSGLGHYSQRLTSGESKIRILYDIATSPEGQARQALHNDLAELAKSLANGGVPQHSINLKDLRHLVTLKDDEFVQKAYLLFLRREADAEGLAVYQQALRNGLSKIRILHSLAYSDEGRRFRKTVSVRLYLMLARVI